MMRKLLATLLAVLLSGLAPTAVWAQGPCSAASTYATGDQVTAANLNANFSQVATTNMEFSCLDDMSSTATEMRQTTDPFASGTESLATTGNGEIQRLRFMWLHVMGYANWYRHDQDLALRDRAVNNHLAAMTAWRQPFGGMTGLDSASTRFHLMGIGLYSANAHPESAFLLYHVNSTTRFMVGIGGDVHANTLSTTANGSAAFPALRGANWHGTGVFFPAADHVAVSAGGAGQVARFHAQGLVTHAVLFMHAVSGTWSGFRAHAGATGQTTWQLPAGEGTVGQALTTLANGGTLAWASVLGEPWRLSSGNLIAGPDNSFDVGASGATRPRDIYAAKNLHVAGYGYVGSLHLAGSVILANWHAVTIASEGTGAANIELISTKDKSVFAVTCNDSSGGCQIKLTEDGVQGQLVVFFSMNSNTLTFPAVTNQQLVAVSGTSLTSPGGNVSFIYLSNQWTQWNTLVNVQ